MKFSISVEEIQKVMKLCSVVVKINAIDSSGRLLIEARDGGVEFVAVNETTGITCFIDSAEVEEPGTVSVLYSKIRAFVSSFAPWDGETGATVFNFKTSDKTTKITVNNVYPGGKVSKGKLALTNFNPELIHRPSPFEKAQFSLRGQLFNNATTKVCYAVDPNADSVMPALQGMLMSFDKDYITFAGTNGAVLSEFKVNNDVGVKSQSLILSYDFFMGLKKLIVSEDQLLWEIKGRRALVKFGSSVFSGNLIIGHDYPEYGNNFASYTDKIHLRKDVLMSVISPITEVLNPDDNFRMTFEIRDKTIRVFNDQANVELELDIDGGRVFSIDLNGKLLKRVLESITADMLLMLFSDENSVLVFDSSKEENQKSLITPLRRY